MSVTFQIPAHLVKAALSDIDQVLSMSRQLTCKEEIASDTRKTELKRFYRDILASGSRREDVAKPIHVGTPRVRRRTAHPGEVNRRGRRCRCNGARPHDDGG